MLQADEIVLKPQVCILRRLQKKVRNTKPYAMLALTVNAVRRQTAANDPGLPTCWQVTLLNMTGYEQQVWTAMWRMDVSQNSACCKKRVRKIYRKNSSGLLKCVLGRKSQGGDCTTAVSAATALPSVRGFYHSCWYLTTKTQVAQAAVEL